MHGNLDRVGNESFVVSEGSSSWVERRRGNRAGVRPAASVEEACTLLLGPHTRTDTERDTQKERLVRTSPVLIHGAVLSLALRAAAAAAVHVQVAAAVISMNAYRIGAYLGGDGAASHLHDT